MKELSLLEAFEARFGTIDNPVGLCGCGCHEYNEEQEMYDGYDIDSSVKEDKINAELLHGVDPFWAEFHSNEESEEKGPIENTIEEVFGHPGLYNDEYVAACVRARAAYNIISDADNEYAEAEAIIAYAKKLEDLKRFW